LEETDDPVIREALQNRLEQLRAERQRWQHGGRKG
jgi:FtsZ-binding cell division protein ZapB